MKLCLFKVAKSDVCIRSLFANPVTYEDAVVNGEHLWTKLYQLQSSVEFVQKWKLYLTSLSLPTLPVFFHITRILGNILPLFSLLFLCHHGETNPFTVACPQNKIYMQMIRKVYCVMFCNHWINAHMSCYDHVDCITVRNCNLASAFT